MLSLAIMSPLCVLGFLLLIDWVDLTPLNDRKRLPMMEQLKLSLPNYLPLVVISLAFATENRVGGGVGVLIAGLVFATHLEQCWSPYFFGISPDQADQFADINGTWALPRIGNHPIPTAEQAFTGLFMLIMMISTGAAAYQMLG